MGSMAEEMAEREAALARQESALKRRLEAQQDALAAELTPQSKPSVKLPALQEKKVPAQSNVPATVPVTAPVKAAAKPSASLHSSSRPKVRLPENCAFHFFLCT